MRDDNSLVEIFELLRGSLARAIQHIVPPKEIEDIVQETYLRICKAEQERKIRSPRSFMYRTAKNLALDYVKRAESRLAESFDENDESTLATANEVSDATVDRVCSEEEFSLFCDSIAELPGQCRRAFVLKKVYGYSQKEIASLMKISEKTVEKQIATGFRRCAQYLAQQHAHAAPKSRSKPLRLVTSSGRRKQQ